MHHLEAAGASGALAIQEGDSIPAKHTMDEFSASRALEGELESKRRKGWDAQ